VTKATFDLLSLAQQDTTLRQVGSYWIGPCPFCGGTDRFNVKRTTQADLWICRICGNGHYKDAIDYLQLRNGWSFTRASNYVQGDNTGQLPARAMAQAQDNERAAMIDKKLEQFTTQEIWEALHRRMAQEQREWWRAQGIPDDWQDYLKLGYTPDKRYISGLDGQIHTSAAYTIPYFIYPKQFVTLQYRLCDPASPKDRYRFENHLKTSYYLTTPTMPIAPNVIICEGAKKAIVVRTCTHDMKSTTVLGVPSKSDMGGVWQACAGAKDVWIVLDPDATNRAEELASKIGKAARIVELPIKVDEALLRGGLLQDDFANLLRQGIKL
jgi:hypothetical protein